MGEPLQFSEYFNVSEEIMEKYWAFDIFINIDNPAFIDPFLLWIFPEYKKRYEDIVEYLTFLKINNEIIDTKTQEKMYFNFHEIKETHLWYIQWSSDKGAGLWNKFVKELRVALNHLEQLNEDDLRIEKLALFTEGVWRDKVSDFITNLILGNIATFTENVCKESNILSEKRRKIIVRKCVFDKEQKSRGDKQFELPIYNWKYILLVPECILTTTDDFLNKKDFHQKLLSYLPQSLENDELRFKLTSILKQDILSKEDKLKEILQLVPKYPEIYKKYTEIKYWEADEAKQKNQMEIAEYKGFKNAISTVNTLLQDFNPKNTVNSLEEAYRLIKQFKYKIQDCWLYKIFYKDNGDVFPEKFVQSLFVLSRWYSKFCVDSEVDNGSWPVDFKISKGVDDITIIEFKLWKNSKLEHGLTTQSDKYWKSNNTRSVVRVVFCVNKKEVEKVESIVNRRKLDNVEIISIEKQKSASKI